MGWAGRIREARDAIVLPGFRQRSLGRPIEDDLLAVAGEARLHEQLDVAVPVGAGDVESNDAALRGLADELLDEPEADVAGRRRADPVELHDRPLVAE